MTESKMLTVIVRMRLVFFPGCQPVWTFHTLRTIIYVNYLQPYTRRLCRTEQYIVRTHNYVLSEQHNKMTSLFNIHQRSVFPLDDLV